jgi:hypothetical protein
MQGAEPPEPPVRVATEQLRFIRDVMARSEAFTAVPGWGSVAMGLAAFVGAPVAALQVSPDGWLLTWLATAGVAIGIGAATLFLKARAGNVPVRSGAGRRYVLSLLPPLAAGALLTLALWQADQAALLPALWLLLYGAGTITGGAFSVRIVPLMGLAFMAFGTAALFVPFDIANWVLGLGFGGLHIIFGLIIAKNHGG